MFNPVSKTFQFGDQSVILETGKIARQATGAVVVTMGDTQVLATVVGKKQANPGQAFFPLTVNYQEKTYAVGKIPGGFFKREGRPTEKETGFDSAVLGCLLPGDIVTLLEIGSGSRIRVGLPRIRLWSKAYMVYPRR